MCHWSKTKFVELFQAATAATQQMKSNISYDGGANRIHNALTW